MRKFFNVISLILVVGSFMSPLPAFAGGAAAAMAAQSYESEGGCVDGLMNADVVYQNRVNYYID